MDRCCIIRRRYVKLGTLTPAGIKAKSAEWRVEPCDAMLVLEAEKKSGVCASCARGWRVPENYPVDSAAIPIIVAYVEQLWRLRTPAKEIDEVNASTRVGRGEIRRFASEAGLVMDEMDEEFQVALTRMFMRLRREFPDEQWDYVNAATRDLCKKYGIVIPRQRRR